MNKQLKTYVIDIDGTICTNTEGEYEKAKPYKERIKKINKLYNEGHKIIMFTARGYTTKINWEVFTRKQLKNWGLKFHELILNKPFGNFYIDDKGIKDSHFFMDSEKSDDLSNLLDNYEIKIEKVLENKNHLEDLSVLSKSILDSFKNKGKIIWCGNGGSMSDSLHFSAELTGRFNKERNSLPSIVLGSNLSSLSAIANDYGYEKVFSRELSSIGESNDTLILISTSGKSKNIIDCAWQADKQKIKSFCLTSIKINPKDYPESCHLIKVESNDTAIIQQIHSTLIHIICHYIDNKLSNQA